MSSTKNVDKNRIARSFQRGIKTYDDHAQTQKKVSQLLIDKLHGYTAINYDRVLEIGCCTGNLTEQLLNEFPIKNLYLNDLVESFFQHVVEKIGDHNIHIEPVTGDIEKIDLPENLNLVISSATFQWLANLPLLFERISNSLVKDGFLAFSIFGPGTLKEFREVTGIGLDYQATGSILDKMENHFHIEEVESSVDCLYFETVRDVLRHLQATGVGGVTQFTWTPRKIRKFEKIYLEKFGGPSGIPVTYMSSSIIASKKG